MLSSTPLPTRQTRPNSSMFSSTPLPTRQTRQTRPNSSMLSSTPLPTHQTRPNPTLTPIVLSHASFNAEQYTDLLIVDATASSYRFKACGYRGCGQPHLAYSRLIARPSPYAVASRSASHTRRRLVVRLSGTPSCAHTLLPSHPLPLLDNLCPCLPHRIYRNDLGVTMDKGKLDYCRLGGSLYRQSRLFSSTAHAFNLFLCFRHTRFRCPRPHYRGSNPYRCLPDRQRDVFVGVPPL